MNSSVMNQKSWFALYVKPRHEFKVRDELDSIKIKNYLPVITKVKQWSDRKKKISEPLIKGYVFIFANEKDRLQSLELSSVVKCLFEHGRAAKIPEWQILNLQNLLSHEGDFRVLENLVSGSIVEIIDGPFKGVRGIIDKSESVNRLAVSIDLLNRSIVVHLPKESITQTT